MHPMQEVVIDEAKIVRFRENAIVCHVLDAASAVGIDLNSIAVGDFSDDDRRQFAQLIGYSVSGYGELSYVDDPAWDAAEKAEANALATAAL